MSKSYICNVFCNETIKGNPCGVIILDEWPDDDSLLETTNLLAQPVTSFVCKQQDGFYIRWFSLTGEINLCGHGSLGAGAVLLASEHSNVITLNSKYGQVSIRKNGHMFTIVLPAWLPDKTKTFEQASLFTDRLVTSFSTRDLIMILDSQEAVASFKPDYTLIASMPEHHALIVSAVGDEHDYVLRYFAPKIGIDEDIATGSAQCSLAPYWFSKFGRSQLTVRQLSSDGGYFEVGRESDNAVAISANVEILR